MGWLTQIVIASQVIIIGPDDGLFVYSGTPAAGNLIISAAAEAGTDPYGNAYPKGLFVAQGLIKGSVFEGSEFVLNQQGAFFYG